MTRELFYQAILKFVLGAAIIGILIFLPARTFDYWNAWLFMGILFIPMFFAGIVMMIKNPELLKKRLKNPPTPTKIIVERHYAGTENNAGRYEEHSHGIHPETAHIQKTRRPIRPSQEQLLSDLAEPRQQISDGKGLDMEDALKRIGKQHGFI